MNDSRTRLNVRPRPMRKVEVPSMTTWSPMLTIPSPRTVEDKMDFGSVLREHTKWFTSTKKRSQDASRVIQIAAETANWDDEKFERHMRSVAHTLISTSRESRNLNNDLYEAMPNHVAEVYIGTYNFLFDPISQLKCQS
jgi:hypothetical protein